MPAGTALTVVNIKKTYGLGVTVVDYGYMESPPWVYVDVMGMKGIEANQFFAFSDDDQLTRTPGLERVMK